MGECVKNIIIMTSDNSRDQLLVRSRLVNTLLKTTIREICLVVNILYFYKKTPLVFDTIIIAFTPVLKYVKQLLNLWYLAII